ncbi:MAG: hypothetical protein ACE5NW_10910 [Acidiferrobacterales bacterium]
MNQELRPQIETPEGEPAEQDWVRCDFDSYKIWYNSRYPYEAIIRCYHRGNLVGKVAFFEDKQPPMQNECIDQIPLIHYPLSRFQDILSMLRHERSVHLLYNTLNHTGHLVTNTLKPVGEGE